MGLGSWVTGNKSSFTSRDEEERRMYSGQGIGSEFNSVWSREMEMGRVGSRLIWVQIKASNSENYLHLSHRISRKEGRTYTICSKMEPEIQPCSPSPHSQFCTSEGFLPAHDFDFTECEAFVPRLFIYSQVNRLCFYCPVSSQKKGKFFSNLQI